MHLEFDENAIKQCHLCLLDMRLGYEVQGCGMRYHLHEPFSHGDHFESRGTENFFLLHPLKSLGPNKSTRGLGVVLDQHRCRVTKDHHANSH